MDRPEHKEFVITGYGFNFSKPVGLRGHILVFSAHQRPELPAVQTVAVAQIKKRIKVVVGNHIPLAGFTVNRKQDKENFVAEQPVLEMAIEGRQRGIIFIRVRRTLLEVNREKGETSDSKILRVLAAGKSQQLANLPPIFSSKAPVGKDRIKQVVLVRFHGGIGIERK